MQSDRRLTLVAIMVTASAITVGAGTFLWFADWTETYLRTCETANRNRDWNELGGTAKSWSQWNPHEAEAWWYRALAAEAQEDWEQAVRFLEVIPPTGARAGRAYLKRTEILFNHLHRQSDALACCQHLLEADSHNCDAHRWIIFIHAVTSRHAELLRQIQRAHLMNCGSLETIDYFMRADMLAFANAFDLISQFLTVTPDDETCRVARALLIARGPLPKEAGAILGDRTEIAECFRRFPHNPDVLEFYLDVASGEGDIERVNDLLSRFTAANQDDNRYWFYVAWRHSQLSELPQAEQAMRKALELYPFDLRTQNLLSVVLRRLEQQDEAEQWAKTATLGRSLKEILHKIPRASMFTPQLLEQIAAYAKASGDDTVPSLIREQLRQSPSLRRN